MQIDPLEQLKYPIGKAKIPEEITEIDIQKWIKILDSFPRKMRLITQKLSDEQLDTPYRDGGWTIRQVIHHVVDSHYNSYIRFKWTLTEDKPVIKAYHEDRWAELNDYKAPIELSLTALESLHAKWVYLLKGLSKEELKRVFIHPDTNEEVSLEKNIGIYAWHSKHHYTHIGNLLIDKDWF
ncbi:putative metal-dependent hydrolase [Lutimonas halocynthiae]|uniref:YfiT family bacillithiol transferase n=1 Tax=Lutimonas halocynthiae TaxID=1446477 RepID=UPI0025B4E72E|nr:putative metal-dependent hydrolase [Lutimonas halocynthiae]MDN3643730.1 putative metal-dependent hydrolase [Lutimonas halocynthiae]